MDASVALMNQYTMISAQFPPLQTTATPSTSSNPTTLIDDEKATTPENNAEKEKSKNDEPNAAPSNHSDEEAGPSTSQKLTSIETVEIDGNIVTIEDIGRNDSSETGDAISEVRRRRLERFEAKGQES